ncbi:ROK family protein [Pedococcus bigeumensis]|uniref:ROK family protein n=1 Tax=Pedococcus bigeumensis TaxID=433644 RepID=UPI002FEC0EF0
MPATETVAAVDIGGTKTAAALVTRDGEVVARLEAPTPGGDGATAILQTAADLVLRLRAGSAAPTVHALGVGSAGVLDAATGFVLGATDVLRGWAGTDLRGSLASATGLPTAVVNDVHAHAIGEARRGVARGARTVLFVGVGTGVGGAFVIDGAALAGAHSAAGHLGHQPSPYAGKLACSCGGAGHLEAIAAGPTLQAEYERRFGTTVSDLRAIAAMASDGQRLAIDTLAFGGAAVGSAIGGLVNVLDPHVVVVGGGVSNVGEVWWDALRAAVRREALPSLASVPVQATALGPDAALVGAAEIAWETVE